jgi:hypothetical protein
MQVLNIAEVGEVKIKKLSKRDWEFIRNNCIKVDPETRTEQTEAGSFIKYCVLFGVVEAPFFKSKYEGKRLDYKEIKERENEYYDCDVSQNILDTISQKIREHNVVDEQELKEVKKE